LDIQYPSWKEITMSKQQTGAISLEDIGEYEAPRGKWTYDWNAIAEAVTDGKAYLLGKDAKRNSIESGLKRNNINGKVVFTPNEKAYNEGKGQIAVIPK